MACVFCLLSLDSPGEVAANLLPLISFVLKSGGQVRAVGPARWTHSAVSVEPQLRAARVGMPVTG